jgi:membrane protein implicated in regulation of membrane protease activity
MTWWGWMIIGALLFGAELFAIDAQFYLVFLGLSAALVGLLGLAGVEIQQWSQWMLFAALSLISMVTFRKALYNKIRGKTPDYKEGVNGEFVEIKSDLAPGNTSSIELRGSVWKARNVGTSTIAAGTKVKILETEGLTLHVRGDQSVDSTGEIS